MRQQMRGHPPQLDGLAAKTKSPVFKWVHLGTPASGNWSPSESGSNPPGARHEQRPEEAGAGLHSSHHRYSRGSQRSLTCPQQLPLLVTTHSPSFLLWLTMKCFHSHRKFCSSVSITQQLP